MNINESLTRMEPLEQRRLMAANPFELLELGAGGYFTSDVEHDAAGNAYASVFVRETADIDARPEVEAIVRGFWSEVLVKLGPSGELLWHKRMFISNTDNRPVIDHLALAPDGSVYAAGFLGDAFDFDTGPGVDVLGAHPDPDEILGEVFLWKLSSAGEHQWVQRFEAPANYFTRVDRLALDSSGNPYVAGVSFANVPHPGPFDPPQGPSGFLARFDPADGRLVWQRLRGPRIDAIGFDQQSNPALLEHTTEATRRIRRLDGIFNITRLTGRGRFVSMQPLIRGQGFYSVDAVFVDQAGEAIVVGESEIPLEFDPGPGQYVLSNKYAGRNARSMFFAKYTASGGLVFAKRIANAVVDGAAIDPMNGDLLVGGQFTGETDFDPAANSAAIRQATGPAFLPTNRRTDLYVARYSGLTGRFVSVHQVELPRTQESRWGQYQFDAQARRHWLAAISFSDSRHGASLVLIRLDDEPALI